MRSRPALWRQGLAAGGGGSPSTPGPNSVPEEARFRGCHLPSRPPCREPHGVPESSLSAGDLQNPLVPGAEFSPSHVLSPCHCPLSSLHKLRAPLFHPQALQTLRSASLACVCRSCLLGGVTEGKQNGTGLNYVKYEL